MTMTIGAVRNVSFGDSAQDLINSEGKYSTQAPLEDIPADSFEKKSNKTAIAAGASAVGLLAAAAGLAYAAKHGKLDKWHVEDLKAVENNKIMAHIKEYTYQAAKKCQEGYDWVAKLFSRKADETAAAVEKNVDEVTPAAEKATEETAK